MAFGTLLASCSSSFLDETPNGYLSPDQMEESAKWNPSLMLGQAAGIAQTSFAMGTGGTSNHDDFGQKSIDIATDLMSGDMVMGGTSYGWFVSDARLLNNTRTRNRAYQIWRYYFQIIKAANSIFDTCGGDENMPEEGTDNRIYYGQAKAFRAYAYLNLVNLYARSYEESKNTKALPIYRTQLVNETVGFSTVEQIYAFILKDLEDATVALEGQSRETKKGSVGEIKDVPDEWVAYGLMAYAYLQKGEYDKAAEAALAVIEGGKYPMMTAQEILYSGFNSDQISSFMWAVDLTVDNSPGLPTFWGHVDIFTYSYAAAGDLKLISDNLYDEIPNTDYRKKWFYPGGADDSGLDYAPCFKFYDNAMEVMGNRRWDNDEVYMRSEEMYLILAEASARNNDLATARVALQALLAERDRTTAAAVATMDKDELLEQIYYNWRVELWGEGRGLMTLKRFKKTAVRGNNDAARAGGYQYNWDDSRLYFEIPERETTNNPNI